MSPEDRDEVTRSVATLWTFNAAFISQLLWSLREEGVLSEAACQRLLERLDGQVDVLEGADEQSYAMGLLAGVRAILATGR